MFSVRWVQGAWNFWRKLNKFYIAFNGYISCYCIPTKKNENTKAKTKQRTKNNNNGNDEEKKYRIRKMNEKILNDPNHQHKTHKSTCATIQYYWMAMVTTGEKRWILKQNCKMKKEEERNEMKRIKDLLNNYLVFIIFYDIEWQHYFFNIQHSWNGSCAKWLNGVSWYMFNVPYTIRDTQE